MILKEKINIIKSCFVACVTGFLFLFSCYTPSILVTREQNAGDAYFNNHRYSEAIVHYRKMLEASAKLGIYRNLQMEASVCRKLANCYEMTGIYANALEYVDRALKTDSLAGHTFGLIEDYRQRGKIYVYMGLYYNGISSLEKALMLSEGMSQSLKNEYRLIIADNYLALGQLYAVMGRAQLSLGYIDKALTIFRQAGQTNGEMEAYLTLGSVYADQGDLITASQFVENSLKLSEKLKLNSARHNHLLATIASEEGDYEKALRYQERSLEEAGKTKITAQIIWATVGLGDIYRSMGDDKRAGLYYRRAGELREETGIKAGSLDASIGLRMGDVAGANRYFSSEGSVAGNAITSLRLAEIMINSGKTDSAIYYLDIAGKSFSSTGNRLGLSNTYLFRSKIYNDMGNYFLASLVIDSALRLSDFPEIKWKAYFEKGRIYENSGEDDRAINEYRNSIDIIEKIRSNLTVDEFRSTFLENKREVYNRLIRLLQKNKMSAEAFKVSELARARAFYDMLANRKIDFRGSIPGDLVAREQEKRIELQNLYRMLQRSEAGSIAEYSERSAGLSKMMKDLSRVQSEYEEILRMIKLNNPAYAEVIAAEPVDAEGIQAELEGHSALISYWINDDNTVCWLVTGSGTTGLTINVTYKYMADLVEKARNAIKSNDSEILNNIVSELYKLLLGPFEKYLEGFTDIIVIPNGPLHFLPFQVLKDNNGRYLVERFNITYSPSASVYMVCREKPPTGDSLFLGAALSDFLVENKPGLPGTEDELMNILPLFPKNIYATGRDATETFVRKNAEKCNIIHLATHGSHNYVQPLYSCLFFPSTAEDDGRLNVWEVLEMNLKAQLVTLSACETGMGNVSRGDEMTGLSRAFLLAGSPTVVVSLWAVADYPTSFLMTKFYEYLKIHPVQQALTLAQRDAMKIYPQPLYWAPFVVIGNGNTTLN
ncbi:MAG: CHAT domain-containing protein [Bacteroidales bacterium]